MKVEPGLTHEEMFARGVYPVLYGREERFPNGESLSDLQARAEKAVEELIMPYVWEQARMGGEDLQVAVVSHGLAISELIAALMRKDAGAAGGSEGKRWTGLLNTAWTQMTIQVVVRLFSFDDVRFSHCSFSGCT